MLLLHVLATRYSVRIYRRHVSQPNRLVKQRTRLPCLHASFFEPVQRLVAKLRGGACRSYKATYTRCPWGQSLVQIGGPQSLVGTLLLAFPVRGAGRLRLPQRRPHAVHGFAAGQPEVYLRRGPSSTSEAVAHADCSGPRGG